MSLTLFAFVLLFALWLLVLVLYIKNCVATEKQGHHYLDVISALRQLFEHLPQHRGMANAYLQGDDSFKAKLTEVQRRIDDDIDLLDRLLSCCADEPVTSRWRRLKSDWGSLKSQVKGMAAAESFQIHTNLVMEVIYLFDDAAARSSVCEAESSVAKLRDIVFSQLPMMMEFVGRARGIGTGVASRQSMSVADRVKLAFLSRRVEQAISQSGQTLAGMLAGQSMLASQASIVDESRQLTQNFVQLLNSGLLATESIQIKPTDYYEAGTVAIDKNLALFDGLLPMIVNHAEQSRRQLRFRIKMYCAAMLAVGLSLATMLLT